MISGSNDGTIKLVYLWYCLLVLPISTCFTGLFDTFTIMCTNVDADRTADWCTFTLSLDSIDSSCHSQLVLCCNDDREKHFYCGEGTFELAAE